MIADKILNSNKYLTNYNTLIEYCRSVITDFEVEQLWMFFLNKQNQIIDNILLEKGNSTSIAVNLNKILSLAANQQSSAIILAHTHPSDKLSPSTADRNLTKQIYQHLLNADIKLQDHIIIGKTDYFSFAQSGILYNIEHDNNK